MACRRSAVRSRSGPPVFSALLDENPVRAFLWALIAFSVLLGAMDTFRTPTFSLDVRPALGYLPKPRHTFSVCKLTNKVFREAFKALLTLPYDHKAPQNV